MTFCVAEGVWQWAQTNCSNQSMHIAWVLTSISAEFEVMACLKVIATVPVTSTTSFYICLSISCLQSLWNFTFPRCSPLRDTDGLGGCLLHGGDQQCRVAHCEARQIQVWWLSQSPNASNPLLDPFGSFLVLAGSVTFTYVHNIHTLHYITLHCITLHHITLH